MAGVVRLVLGVLFLLAGILLILTLVGFILGAILLIIGLVLIASGLSAREDTARLQQQQQQTNFLLQQQLQLNQAMAARTAAPGYSPATPGYGAPSSTAERFCPYCGQGNLRAASFCQRCGRPLPAMN